MACYDCHNAVGHPFPNPATVVDEAIRSGKIDRSLPETKARASPCQHAGDITGEPKDREARVDKLIADATAKANTPSEHKQAEQKFNKAMREILLTASFQEKASPGSRSPTTRGTRTHRDASAATTASTTTTRARQSACSARCATRYLKSRARREGNRRLLVPDKAGEKQPESHQRPNFMHTHSEDVGRNAKMPRNPAQAGQAGGNFCSNPACHGRTWPGMDLTTEPPKKAATEPAKKG